MLGWSFFLVLLVTVVQQSSAIKIKTMCHGHAYGTLLPNPQECSSYYVCQAGPQLVDCDYGLHFDRIKNVCNWPGQANCQLEEVENDLPEADELLLVEPDKMCLEHPSGTLFPNTKDCASYYVCHPGPQLLNCDLGLHFDRMKRVCNWPDKADCHFGDAKHDLLLKQANQAKQTLINVKLPTPNQLENIAKPTHTQSISKVPEGDKKNSQVANHDPNSKPSLEIEVPVREKDYIIAAKVPTLNEWKEQTIKKSENPTPLEVAVVVPVSLPNFETPDRSRLLKNSIPMPEVANVISPEVPSNKLPLNLDRKIESSKPQMKGEMVVAIPADNPSIILMHKVEGADAILL